MKLPHFQRVPHFPGSQMTPDDLLLPKEDLCQLLEREVYVCEKLDGLSVTVARTGRHRIEWSLRPAWEGALGGALRRGLDLYMQQRYWQWHALLPPGWIAYGEWLWHQLHVHYDALPDLFFCYAMEDPRTQLLPFEELQDRCKRAGVTATRWLWRGILGDVQNLKAMVAGSQFGSQPMEGLIVELVEHTEFATFGKWVEPEYVKIEAGQMSGKKNGLTPEAAAAML